MKPDTVLRAHDEVVVLTRAVDAAGDPADGLTAVRPAGARAAGRSATAQINRRDFGIDISIPMDGGGVAVGDKVSISLEIEAVLQK